MSFKIENAFIAAGPAHARSLQPPSRKLGERPRHDARRSVLLSSPRRHGCDRRCRRARGCPGCSSDPPGKGPVADAAYAEAKPVIDALERFKAAKGQYPAKLAELVPAYVPRVPPESGAGTVFTYEPKGNSYTLSFSYSGPGMNNCHYVPGKTWSCSGHY
jgi:hypothetical protein